MIGKFWLYSDANANDTLDRITHPKIAARDSELAVLQAESKRSLERLLQVASISEKWIPYQDTFLLDSTGTFAHYNGGKPDTLYISRGKKDTKTWTEILFRRFRLLKNYNAWQNFFALRKKAQEYAMTPIPMPDHSFLLPFSDWRKLFPLPGMEREFETRLQAAGDASMKYLLTVEALQSQAQDSGWIDFPFDGFDQPLTDWVAGKGSSDFVLYFPTRASLQRVVEAERGGSFRVDNIEKAGLGYNLLNCDDQYRCRVLGPSDSIYIQLGEHESQFDPPSSALQTPIREFRTVPLPSDSLEKYAGRYEYKAYHPILVLRRDGELWCDIPWYGVHRLSPAGPSLFYAPGKDLQIEFVARGGNTISKLLLYAYGARAVAPRSDSVDYAEALGQEVARLASRRRGSMRWIASLPSAFGFGADTMHVGYFTNAGNVDSIELSCPRLAPQIFYPANDSQAFSPASRDQIEFRRNETGVPMGIWLISPESRFFLPNLSYRPRKPADLRSEPVGVLDNPVSESAGSGKDTYVGLGGLRRFGCAEDGLYLRSGDGWVLEMRKGTTGDDISLGAPGNGLLLRVSGRTGKHIKLALALCGEKGVKSQRVFLEVRGSSDRDGPWTDVLSEADWAHPGEKADTLSISPLAIPSDPYYLNVNQVPTLGDTSYYSIDGYRAFSE
ncbi:MAG TPA: hypothetical protein VJ385_21415 [Fibrobacteria bacterium]|nr:hypothetical protein [Fibrobacteria bacterium]